MENTENKVEASVPAAPAAPAATAGGDSLFREFWLFLKEEKKWWLGPIVLMLVTLSAILIFTEGSSIAPFIYSLF